MSKLLIDEQPLQILPITATIIGLNEAIVLQQVHYWIDNAQKGNNKHKFIDGKYWVYNTYEEWQKNNFPFWSVETIKRAFLSLEEKKLIISAQLEGNHRRKWYTINYKELDKLDKEFQQVKMTRSKRSKRTDATGQNDPMLTETTSENTQETTTAEVVLPQKVIDTVSELGLMGKENAPSMLQKLRIEMELWDEHVSNLHQGHPSYGVDSTQAILAIADLAIENNAYSFRYFQWYFEFWKKRGFGSSKNGKTETSSSGSMPNAADMVVKGFEDES